LDEIEKHLALWEGKNIIWIHAASLGEYEMSRPIIAALKAQQPDLKFVISFYSPSGYQNVNLDKKDFLKIYLGLDLFSIQSHYVSIINPKAVMFIKYEFWFNFLRVLKVRRIPYYFTSLHLNDNSYLFKPFFSAFLYLLKCSAGIYCHNSAGQNTLLSQGFNNTFELGDTRINQVLQNKKVELTIEWKSKGSQVVVFGSVLKNELPFVLEFINKNQDINFIIAPHEVNEHILKIIARQINNEMRLYSDLKTAIKTNILLVDTIGDLKYMYNKSDLAYVGGGFDKGPHNVLEPIVFNVPTICGPNISKFPMAQKLNHEGILHIINEKSSFHNLARQLLLQAGDDYVEISNNFIEKNKANLNILVDDILNNYGE